MKKCTLIGRLGKDARLVESKNGSKFVSFTMAVNTYMGGKEKTTWFDVISFNFSEKMVPHLTKGSGVEVFGDFDTTLEIGNDGKPYLRNDVRADWFDFARGTSQSNNTQSGSTRSDVVVSDNEITITTTDSTSGKVKTTEPIDMNDDTDLPF